MDLTAVLEGRKEATALSETVATREAQAKLQPAHAIYVYAQNVTLVLAEQLTMVREVLC